VSLFDTIVSTALQNTPNLSTLRVVVEKELLHHDILRVLSKNNFLKDLVFIGGTCLRACYGATRLSEDLDFTGGHDFDRAQLSTMAGSLIENLEDKYGLPVIVSVPEHDKSNVDTWKIKIQTRPTQKHFPSQHVHLDICAVPSYQVQPMMIRNMYGVDMETSGLILQVQSREEIFTDKLLSFAFSPNRLKYRDLWDILWLSQESVKPAMELIMLKLEDRNYKKEEFLERFKERLGWLTEKRVLQSEFFSEMQRFLPQEQRHTIEQKGFWEFLVYLLNDLYIKIEKI